MTAIDPMAWLCADAARVIDRRIACHAPVPDLADVFARMDRGPGVPMAAAIEDERADDHVIPLARARALAHAMPGALAPFAAALRTRIEDDLRERRLTAIPDLARPPTRLRLVLAALATAIAAALLLSVVPLAAERDDQRDAVTVDAAARSSAARIEARPWRAMASSIEPRRVARPRRDAPVAVRAPDPPRPPAPTLAALEASAEQRWRAGDLAGAEQALRRIVARDRGGRAELAYADLFALARQRGGRRAELALWREYLGRFARGRFADDARAGICRVEGSTACWAAYLREHPRGSHRDEATRRLAPSRPAS